MTINHYYMLNSDYSKIYKESELKNKLGIKETIIETYCEYWIKPIDFPCHKGNLMLKECPLSKGDDPCFNAKKCYIHWYEGTFSIPSKNKQLTLF
jgi:hypothetical protein